MIKITSDILNRTSEQAKASPRRRMNCNFHKNFADPVQRLLNAIEPGTYIRPHKHEDPDKTELFVILRGRAVALQFDDKGGVADHFILDAESGAVGVEFTPRTWHTFFALEPGTVLFEVKEGPYIENTDKNFAAWAPAEGAKEVPAYIEKILGSLGLAVRTR